MRIYGIDEGTNIFSQCYSIIFNNLKKSKQICNRNNYIIYNMSQETNSIFFNLLKPNICDSKVVLK